jgi:hypothetical protein
MFPSGMQDPKRQRPVAYPIKTPKKFRQQMEDITPDSNVPRVVPVSDSNITTQAAQKPADTANQITHNMIIRELGCEIVSGQFNRPSLRMR